MLAFSNDYYGMIFRATQSVELFCAYFATFKNNEKVKEMKQNQNVAFTTIPKKENEHIKARGTAIKSKQTIFDLADCFCEKIPDYRETIEYGGKSLIVYEIHFETATVTLDLSNSKTLKL